MRPNQDTTTELTLLLFSNTDKLSKHSKQKKMKEEILEKAKEYISLGLSVVPIAENKRPCLTAWKPLETKALTEDEINTLFKIILIRKLCI